MHCTIPVGSMLLLMMPQMVVHELDLTSPLMPPPLWFTRDGEVTNPSPKPPHSKLPFFDHILAGLLIVDGAVESSGVQEIHAAHGINEAQETTRWVRAK